jgi:predicted nucleic acid-binding protein
LTHQLFTAGRDRVGDGVVDEVFPIELRDVERARDVLLAAAELSARDALHAAVMERRGIQSILTFDGGFDSLPGVRRLT